MMDDLCKFLQGRTDPILQRLQSEMELAAEAMQFEKAASFRDQIRGIETVVQRQKVISSDQTDSDVIAYCREDGEALYRSFSFAAQA